MSNKESTATTTPASVYSDSPSDLSNVSIDTTDTSDNNKHQDQKQPQEGGEEEDSTSTEGKAAQAYDPETGEINWDCPCLGGMAHGTCGEEFKAAFSCFVYSKEEPKGMDCIDAFKAMQTCFREHPEEYADELDDDDDDDDEDKDGSKANEKKDDEDSDIDTDLE